MRMAKSAGWEVFRHRSRGCTSGTPTSIRQRVLSGHHPDRESNHSLRDWLRVAKSGELWFATLPAEAVDSVESHLIRQLQPAFNVRKKVSVHVA